MRGAVQSEQYPAFEGHLAWLLGDHDRGWKISAIRLCWLTSVCFWYGTGLEDAYECPEGGGNQAFSKLRTFHIWINAADGSRGGQTNASLYLIYFIEGRKVLKYAILFAYGRRFSGRTDLSPNLTACGSVYWSLSGSESIVSDSDGTDDDDDREIENGRMAVVTRSQHVLWTQTLSAMSTCYW